MMLRFGSKWGVDGNPRTSVSEKGLFSSKLFQDKSLVRQVFQAPENFPFPLPKNQQAEPDMDSFQTDIPVG